MIVDYPSSMAHERNRSTLVMAACANDESQICCNFDVSA